MWPKNQSTNQWVSKIVQSPLPEPQDWWRAHVIGIVYLLPNAGLQPCEQTWITSHFLWQNFLHHFHSIWTLPPHRPHPWVRLSMNFSLLPALKCGLCAELPFVRKPSTLPEGGKLNYFCTFFNNPRSPQQLAGLSRWLLLARRLGPT